MRLVGDVGELANLEGIVHETDQTDVEGLRIGAVQDVVQRLEPSLLPEIADQLIDRAPFGSGVSPPEIAAPKKLVDGGVAGGVEQYFSSFLVGQRFGHGVLLSHCVGCADGCYRGSPVGSTCRHRLDRYDNITAEDLESNGDLWWHYQWFPQSDRLPLAAIATDLNSVFTRCCRDQVCRCVISRRKREFPCRHEAEAFCVGLLCRSHFYDHQLWFAVFSRSVEYCSSHFSLQKKGLWVLPA
ncbi:hypothetical protein HY933_04450 [Candidatus Falkowbacteria bacterium]|nr:hypothetical protein [Candidatus Falkowbacteria bacterium]